MVQHPTKYSHFGYEYLTPIKDFWRRGFHTGLDYNNGAPYADLGQEVFSFGRGKVLYAKNAGIGWGNLIVIEHYFIDEKGELRTVWGRYAHLQKILCKVGDTIQAGTLIGTIGKTGTSVPHLHFDVMKVYPGTNFTQYIWGKTRDWVKEHYANIEFIANNWNNTP